MSGNAETFVGDAVLPIDVLHGLVATELEATPDEFSVSENLIELGLTSVSLLRIHRLLSREHGLDAPPGALAERPTIEHWMTLPGLGRQQTSFVKAEGSSSDHIDDVPFPLTDMQRAYWLGRNPSFELGGVGAHGYLEIQSAPFRMEALRKALDRTIAVHPMLRAVVTEDGFQQTLGDVPPLFIEERDFRSLTAGQKDEALKALRASLSHRVFDPHAWPLFGFAVSHASEDTDILHIGFDVLILDLKSLEIWMDDVFRLYHEPDTLTHSPAGSFQAFIREREQTRRPAARTGDAAYWREKTLGMRPGPPLPLLKPLSEIERPTFSRMQAVLSAHQWDVFRRRAQENGVTASAALLAVYARLLGETAQSDRFSVVTTLFDRSASSVDLEGVIGDFTSLAVLDIDLAFPTFADLCHAVQKTLWDALDHRTVNGVEVLSMLASARAVPNSAIAPYVFTSALGTGRSYLDAVSRFGTVIYGAVQTPQVILDHQALEYDGGLVLNWDYVDSALGAETVNTLVRNTRILLDDLSGSQHRWSVPRARIASPITSDSRTAPSAGTPFGKVRQPARRLSDLEKAVAEIWSAVLDHGPIKHHDADFFLLGGNSLLATRLAAALSDRFGLTFGVIKVFEHTTIERQARFIECGHAAEALKTPVSEEHDTRLVLRAERRAVSRRRRLR